MASRKWKRKKTGVPGISCRGEDTYEIRLSLGRDAQGKPLMYTETYHGKLGDAAARRAELLIEKRQGGVVEPSKETVAQFFRRWLDARESTIRPSTHRWYEKHFRLRIEPALGRLKIRKLTDAHIDKFYSDLRKAGASDMTIAGTHRTLRAALKWAVVKRTLTTSPLQHVDAPRVAKRTMRVYDAAQLVKFLDHVKDHRYHDLFLAAATTGLRQGELLGLRWQDVDLEHGTAHVQQQLEKPGREPVFSEVKTEQGRRAVTLPRAVVAALTALRERERSLERPRKYYDYDLVFHLPNGRPLHPSHVDAALKTLQTEAKVPRIRFHDLRHTHASLLGAAGVHPRVVQERLGHTHVNTTLMLYTHVLPTLQDAAAASMDAILPAQSDDDSKATKEDESEPENPSEN